MDKPAGQTWLPVVGWEGLYEVSDLGLIWSCQRRRGTKGGLLKTPPVAGRGHLQVNLCRDGKPFHVFVHTLVAEAFHGPRPSGMECRHLDGNPANNAAGNLAWGTSSENNHDRVRHGTFTNRNMGKTHCDHGHEFTPENTFYQGSRRRCRACRKRRHQEQAARRKAARAARRAS